MTRASGTVLAIVLAALAAVQHFGLERQPETKAENALRNLPEVSAGDMLPTYVASLFFGAFRAVAIDVLWIQLKKAEEERRWYERRELLKMISYVQPRNPEVWSHLGWHSAYNVANGFTDPEKSWSWIRFGVTWLRQGIRMLPENPHLKFELALTLLHKPSWREGQLDLALLRRIESDAALMRDLLPDDLKDRGPVSPFEISRLWLERAKADILKGGARSYKTQMGLFLYPSSIDGYIRKTLYLEAIRAWQEGDTDLAVRRLGAAEAHVEKMLKTTYPEGPLSSLYKDWLWFYGELPKAVTLHGKARRTGAREDDLAALRALTAVVPSWDQPPDEGFLWSRGDANAPLNALKRRLVGDADESEFNDGYLQGTYAEEGRLMGANLAPAGLDVDWYWLRVDPPHAEHEKKAPAAPPPGLKLKVTFARPEASRADLKVTLLNPTRQDVKTVEVRGKAEIAIPADSWGTWAMRVEPLDPAAPAPADTRYFFQYSASK